MDFERLLNLTERSGSSMAFIMFSFGLIRSESVLGEIFLRHLSSSFRDALQRIAKSDTFFICSGA